MRSSTKWRTCGASIAARSDTAADDRRPSVRQNRYATTGNVAAMARSADVVTTGRPPSTSSVLQSNEYYFARAHVRARSGLTSPRQRYAGGLERWWTRRAGVTAVANRRLPPHRNPPQPWRWGVHRYVGKTPSSRRPVTTCCEDRKVVGRN